MKKLFLLPLVLLGVLAFVTWSCESEKDAEDLCHRFEEIVEIDETCDIPTVCCPLDGGDCYYVNPDGQDYYCDASLDSENNPDGCNGAMDEFINDHCETAKTSPEVRKKLTIELRLFTQELMAKARAYSVCL